jgi:hypothetical protein
MRIPLDRPRDAGYLAKTPRPAPVFPTIGDRSMDTNESFR